MNICSVLYYPKFYTSMGFPEYIHCVQWGATIVYSQNFLKCLFILKGKSYRDRESELFHVLPHSPSNFSCWDREELLLGLPQGWQGPKHSGQVELLFPDH